MSLPPWKAKKSYTAVPTRTTLKSQSGDGRAPNYSGMSVVGGTSSSGSSSNGTTFKEAGSQSGGQSGGQWPESLRAFITRCYEYCTAENGPKLEAQIREKVTNAFARKVVWSTDWDHESLPAVDEEIRRREAVAMSAAPMGGDLKGGLKGDLKRDLVEQKAARKKRRKEASKLSKDGFVETSPTSSPVLLSVGMSSPAQRASPAQRVSPAPLSETTDRLKDRQKRFEREINYVEPVMESLDLVDPNKPLIGRSTVLEKRYLRLTSAPNSDLVRPEPILKQTLELLKDKWKKEQNYSYICDQFKSMRQDLTVQHIENEFTVKVYEIHARIALEKQDLGEYNQCQSRLAELYSKGIKGHNDEFTAYKILYLIHTQNRAEMGKALRNLTSQQLQVPCIKHSSDVNAAIATNNYMWLFQLYQSAPNMGGYVMDSFIMRTRLQALAIICQSFRPNLKLYFIRKHLGFDDEDEEECLQFLKGINVDGHVYVDNENALRLSTKECYAIVEAKRQAAYRKVDIKGQI